MTFPAEGKSSADSFGLRPGEEGAVGSCCIGVIGCVSAVAKDYEYFIEYGTINMQLCS